MSAVRRSVAACALAYSLSGCLTLMGTTAGGLYASTSNNEIAVQQGNKPRTSVAKSMALGAAIGLVLDVALIAVAVNSDGGGNFGH